MVKYKVVLFDVGGVLLPSPITLWKDFEIERNLAPGSITKVIISDELKELFYSLERGEITLPDFENIFTFFYIKKYEIKHRLSTLPIFSFLFESPIIYSSVDKRWITAINALRSAGIRVCIATNNFYNDRARLQATLPKSIHDLGVEKIFESCRLRMRKPEFRLYQHILKTLQCSAENVLFIDDLGVNLKSASQIGIKTIKHNGSIDVTISAMEKILNVSLKNFTYGTRPLTIEDRLDTNRLHEHLLREFPHPASSGGHKFNVVKFVHGQSNPTYHVSCCNHINYVLKKKPSGKLLPSAHQIDREYRIQGALRGIIPIPRLFGYFESVLDTPFYLMEYCEGRVFTDPRLPDLQPSQRTLVYEELCDVLVKLRKINPNNVGLSNYGSQGNYVKRSLKRFIRQYEASKSKTDVPRINELIYWLESNIPDVADEPVSVMHGDLRLDNVIFANDNQRIVAVLDWELSTLGDPLIDLANAMIPYYIPRQFSIIAKGFDSEGPPDGVMTLHNFLHRYFSQLNTNRYKEATRLTASGKLPKWWNFYIAFVMFRNAVIFVGVLSRLDKGQASNPSTASTLRQLPLKFVELALCIAKGQNSYNENAFDEIHSPMKDIFALTPSEMTPNAQSIHRRVAKFIDKKIIPIEQQLWAHSNGPKKWTVDSQMERLKTEARSQGLWNLFITRHLDPKNEFGGAGLSTLEYGHICELMGRTMFAPEIFNCNAPDTGNMEVLIKYGTAEQRRKYLQPLLDGRWRSCFAMTEPDVASSDAANIQGTICRIGDEYLLNARKWYISGAMHPECKVCIFMGRILNRDEPKRELSKHKRQSMVIVDFTAEGITVVRAVDAIGMYDAPGGHAEVLFENVRCPVRNLILGEGRGFEIAQGRLGPGRVHHCMRLIGQAERAVELMKNRVYERIARDKRLKEFQSVRLDIARSRIEIEQARLLVLKTAREIDMHGPKAAAAEIAMIKVVAPKMCAKIVDRAIQLFGAAGMNSVDWPLANFYATARALRLADGPDIVHEETVARVEFQRAHI